MSRELDQTACDPAEGRGRWLILSTHQSVTAVPLQEAGGGRAPAQRPMLSGSLSARAARAASNLEPARRHNAHSAAAALWRYGRSDQRPQYASFCPVRGGVRKAARPPAPCAGGSEKR